MSELLHRLTEEDILSIQKGNPDTKDLVQEVAQTYQTACLPTSVYRLARHFNPELWDINRQRDFLNEIANSDDQGVMGIENRWNKVLDLLNRFSLAPSECQTTEYNFQRMDGNSESIDFPIRFTQKVNINLHKPAIIELVLPGGDYSHALPLDGTNEAVITFTETIKYYNKLAWILLFEEKLP